MTVRETPRRKNNGTLPGSGDRSPLVRSAVRAIVVVAVAVTASCGTDDSAPPRQPPAAQRSSDPRPSAAGSRHVPPVTQPAEPQAVAAKPDVAEPEPEAVAPTPIEPQESPPVDPTQTIESVQREELELAAEVLRAFPGNPDALGLMGAVYNARGNSAEALKYWEKCLELAPNRVDVYDAMGKVAVMKNEHEEAVALFREGLRREGDAPGVRVHLARALLLLGKVPEAIVALEEEIKIASQSDVAHRMLGQARLRLKLYDRAERSFRTSLDIRPHHEAYFGLATVYARTGRKEESRKQMAKFKALKDAGRDNIMRQVNSFDDLESVCRTAAQTCTNAGNVYQRQGFLRSAEKHWRRAAELDPKNTACRIKLVLEAIRQGADAKALRVCDTLIEIEPDNVFHYLRHGDLYARLKQFDAAEQAYRKVIALAPQRSGGYRALAQLLMAAERKPAEAQTLAEEAVRLEPVAINYFVLGKALLGSDNRADARVALQRAVELDPASQSARRLYESLEKEE